MTNRLPHQNLRLSHRIELAIGSDTLHSYVVDVHTGDLTSFGQRIADQPEQFSHVSQDSLAYAQLVGLVTPVGLMADLTTEDERMRDVILSHEGRPTMPPQPTCTHYQGMCDHMVCPRTMAGAS